MEGVELAETEIAAFKCRLPDTKNGKHAKGDIVKIDHVRLAPVACLLFASSNNDIKVSVLAISSFSLIL